MLALDSQLDDELRAHEALKRTLCALVMGLSAKNAQRLDAFIARCHREERDGMVDGESVDFVLATIDLELERKAERLREIESDEQPPYGDAA